MVQCRVQSCRRWKGPTLGVAITSNPNAHVVREYGKYIPEFECIALYTGCEVEDDSERPGFASPEYRTSILKQPEMA